MPTNVDYSDTTFNGQLRFEKTPTVPAGAWVDAQIGANAAISATKLKHQYAPVVSQAHGTAAATERRVIHVARSAGEVVALGAGIVVPAVGAATVTVDLRKNGTTVLSAAVEIDSGDAAYAQLAGVVSVAAYATGDVFEVVVTATAGGGTLPQGLSVSAVFREGSG